MTFWLDAQLSPRLARWITGQFDVAAIAIRDVGLRDADDETIYRAAAQAGSVVITKDRDLVDLQLRLGSPPQILWLTCGNTSEARLQQIFSAHLGTAMQMLTSGEDLVEISGA